MLKHRQQRGHTRDTLQQQVNNRSNIRTSVSTAMPPADRPVREPCEENEMDGQSGPPVDVDFHHQETNKGEVKKYHDRSKYLFQYNARRTCICQY
jgi:hypothetical protein